jgi:alpha-D-ribose 1-methylphosphonate 5-triphosphate synthase subunit PhnL
LDIQEEQVVPSPPARLKQVLPLKLKGGIALESGNTVPLSIEVDGPKLVTLKGKSSVGKTRLIKSLVGLGLEFKCGNYP